MAWRFTPSKYKNTVPTLPKKDGTIYDLPIGNLSCTNNAIHSNSRLLAFLIDGEGGKIGVLPKDVRGRRLRGDLNILCAHGECISDFCFIRFDNFIATCAGGGEKLKIWSCDGLYGDGDNSPVVTNDARSTISIGEGRTILDCLSPHKTAGNLLAVGLAANGPVVVDLNAEKVVISMEAKVDRSLSVNWSDDGSLLILSTDKGKSAALFDPRASARPIQIFQLHGGIGRENRVLFTDGSIVSSGYTSNRAQEVLLFDSRDWTKPTQTEVFEGSTGLLVPLYDPDTKLLFLCGKGACKFFLTEIKSNASKPVMNRLCEQALSEQTLGACLLQKTSCDVMSGEVQRLHQLTKTSIIPIPCIVPRRSYQQFHGDIFPDTIGTTAGCSANEWLSGSKNLPQKVQLCPNAGTDSPPTVCRSDSSISEAGQKSGDVTTKSRSIGEAGDSDAQKKSSIHYRDILVRNDSMRDNSKADGKVPDSVVEQKEANSKRLIEKVDTKNAVLSENKTVDSISSSTATVSNGNAMATLTPTPPVVRMRSVPSNANHPMSIVVGRGNSTDSSGIPSIRSRPKSCVLGTVQSKFRHVEVVAGANKNIYTNLRNVNNRLPTESNGFCVSRKYAAVPLSGSAGLIAILELSSAIKVPDGVVDGLQNGSQVMDLQWNPFCSDVLAVGLDNGTVNVWQIDPEVPCIGSAKFNEIAQRPKENNNAKEITPPVDEKRLADLSPIKTLSIGARTRVTHIRYHPTTSDLLAIGLLSGVIQLCDVENEKCLLEFQAHSEGILSLAWSADGRRLASIGRDAYLRVFEPLLGVDCCVAESKVLESKRAARIHFVCEDTLILLVGFNRSSGRQMTLYRVADLHPLHTEQIDVSTQPLVPTYDYDTSVVFLTGKGDRSIQMFEICPDPPYFLRLTSSTFNVGHQAIGLQHKNVCDVVDVEFASGWRLTEKCMEKLSFRVPRIKKELFQRDVFPNALVSWEPTCSMDEWRNGVLNEVKFVDLRPDGMQEYTNHSQLVKQPSVSTNNNGTTLKTTINNNVLGNDDRRKNGDRTMTSTTTTTMTSSTNLTTIHEGHKPSAENDLKKQTALSWSAKMPKVDNSPLEQDEKEGVDESEWQNE